MAYSKREVAIVVAVALLACMAVAEGAVTCGTVSGNLGQCLSYLTAKVPTPGKPCCAGVVSLYKATIASRPDRLTSCKCIKTLTASLGNKLRSDLISKLPSACGVNLGYPISASTNCDSIK